VRGGRDSGESSEGKDSWIGELKEEDQNSWRRREEEGVEQK